MFVEEPKILYRDEIVSPNSSPLTYAAQIRIAAYHNEIKNFLRLLVNANVTNVLFVNFN